MLQLEKFDDKASLINRLITLCQHSLSQAVAEHGQAHFAVSGGSSPQPAYEALSQSTLPWANIHVAMVDERWVEPSHAASNQAFLSRTLLKDNGASAPFLAMKTDAATAEQGLEEVNQAYRALGRGFDLVILGMGPDAHTASLFPHAQGLPEAMALDNPNACAVIHATQSKVTGEYTERMTLTLAEILRAKQIVLLINGEEKWQAYQQALKCDDVMAMPVAAVLQQSHTPVTVMWCA